MAAEFPPNLDDGELWLPSAIIPDVGAHRRHYQVSTGPRSSYQSNVAQVEDLANQLAALGFVDRTRPNLAAKRAVNLSLQPEGFRPVGRLGPVEQGMQNRFAYDELRLAAGRALSSAGTGTYFADSMAGHRFNIGKPVQTKMDGFGLGTARVRLFQGPQRPDPVRLFPVQRSGSGRECGGTGVFLPRVVDNEAKKKPYMKGGEQEKQTRKNAVAGKRGVTLIQPPPEITLPQEWTY